jgi:ribosome maturation factor RimP
MESAVVTRVWELAEPLVANEGLEIVDIDFQREGRGMMLRFYLDRVGGGVTLDELTPMSRLLGDVVEAHDVIPGRYSLEVSSPGINRRLRRPKHFRDFLGKKVRVRTIEQNSGRRSFLGSLCTVGEDGIEVEVDEGLRFFRFEEIAQANYEHEFGGKAAS